MYLQAATVCRMSTGVIYNYAIKLFFNKHIMKYYYAIRLCIHLIYDYLKKTRRNKVKAS